jgi:hypothetical protein
VAAEERTAMNSLSSVAEHFVLLQAVESKPMLKQLS